MIIKVVISVFLLLGGFNCIGQESLFEISASVLNPSSDFYSKEDDLECLPYMRSEIIDISESINNDSLFINKRDNLVSGSLFVFRSDESYHRMVVSVLQLIDNEGSEMFFEWNVVKDRFEPIGDKPFSMYYEDIIMEGLKHGGSKSSHCSFFMKVFFDDNRNPMIKVSDNISVEHHLNFIHCFLEFLLKYSYSRK